MLANRAHLVILLSIALSVSAQTRMEAKGAVKSGAPAAPLYSISFERGEPVAGVAASRAIALPFQCTSDGTIFVNMVLQQSSPNSFPTEQLVSIPPSGQAHEFRLDQLTDLYDVVRKGYYASESNVFFLVIAASEDKQGIETYVTSEGTKHEVTRNLADRHDYILIFDRDGNYKKKLQMEDSFAVQRVGAFPSGAFLAFGFDKQDHSPRLALLQDDAKFLRFLEIPKGDAPESMFGMKDRDRKGVAIYIAPSQLVPHGDSILIVQNKTEFPLLEVNPAGMIRAIHPKLPKGIQIDTLIASDQNLCALVNPKDDGDIYELNAQDGTVIRRFALDDGARSPVACVHDGKFLSFEHGDGKLVPLVGTAEPGIASGKRPAATPPAN